MERAEGFRSLAEPLADVTEFPVLVSASRSIRDYESPSASHTISSGFLPSRDEVA